MPGRIDEAVPFTIAANSARWSRQFSAAVCESTIFSLLAAMVANELRRKADVFTDFDESQS